MANLVVCADGTWNTPDDKEGGLPAPTNVVRLLQRDRRWQAEPAWKRHRAEDGTTTRASAPTDRRSERWLGGGHRQGPQRRTSRAATNGSARITSLGDRIFLFGFSRGAFTVRSLGGMICCCGLLDLRDLPDTEVWEQVNAAFACYRDPNHKLKRLSKFKFHNATDVDAAPKSTKIHFIGVWDTVGALGIPDDLAFLDLIDDPREVPVSQHRSRKQRHDGPPRGRDRRDAQELCTNPMGGRSH